MVITYWNSVIDCIMNCLFCLCVYENKWQFIYASPNITINLFQIMCDSSSILYLCVYIWRQNTSFASTTMCSKLFFCNFFYSWAINMYKRKFASSVRIHHISALLVSYTWILFSLYHFWRKASFWNIYAIHIQIIYQTIYYTRRKWT